MIRLCGRKCKSRPHAAYDRETSEERIKLAAIELFAERGFKGTTTRMIADRANSNIALISRYFGNKENLFTTLIKDETARIIDKELAYPEKDNLADELTFYLLSNFSEIRKNISFFRMLIHEAMFSPEYQQLLHDMVPRSDQRLIARLARLQDNGQIAPDYDIKQLSIVTNFFMSGVAFRNLIFMDRDVAEIEPYVKSFITVICE